VQITSDQTFGRVLDSASGLTTTQWTVGRVLVDCTVYYWRVRADFGGTPGRWNAASFRVNLGRCP
jgi:hypothetical protein